ncbi:hypothetical protein GCM10022397_20730 [Flavivirga jejuensis]
MRVSLKYNGIPTSCETFTYGEVEDYTINLGIGNSVNTNAKALKTFTETSNKNINMYPNPANSRLTIDILENGFDEITIFTSTGAIIKKVKPSKGSHSIDVSQFMSGMYFVRFVSKRLATTKRFIKQ